MNGSAAAGENESFGVAVHQPVGVIPRRVPVVVAVELRLALDVGRLGVAPASALQDHGVVDEVANPHPALLRFLGRKGAARTAMAIEAVGEQHAEVDVAP